METDGDISEDQKKIVDTMLLEAVQSRNYDRIDLCLKKGADLDARNGDGRTPLMMAVWKDDPELVQFVLQRGPALFLKDNGGKNAFDLIANVSDIDKRGRITNIMLRALPDHVRSRVTGPHEVAAAAQEAAAGEGAQGGMDIATRSDISLSKPVTLAPRKKGGGLSL